MSHIEESFEEGWRIAEHVGMIEEDPSRRYKTPKKKAREATQPLTTAWRPTGKSAALLCQPFKGVVMSLPPIQMSAMYTLPSDLKGTIFTICNPWSIGIAQHGTLIEV